MRRAILPIFMLLIITCFTTSMVSCKPQVPCYFVFGDSFSDAGNNNDLNTKAKANYPPYGVDWPGGIPTGRFSNGRNFVDRITELLGFDEYIPPYSTATGKEILKGVNYASGAAGIRSETGQHLGDRISLDEQLVNHAVTAAKFLWYGKASMLGKCLYTVNMGSNDYINNYFMPDNYPSSSVYTPDEYADQLIRQLSGQLKTLHLLGARKIAVFGLGLVGCSLGEINTFGTNGSLCVDKVNAAVQPFNQKLISLVDDLNSKLSGAQITYIAGSSSTDTGSAVADAPCCDVREDYQCMKSSTPCESRNNYIFWDGFHTTEAVNVLAGETAYDATDTNNVHPMDIKTLVQSTHQEFMLQQLEQRIFTSISSV